MATQLDERAVEALKAEILAQARARAASIAAASEAEAGRLLAEARTGAEAARAARLETARAQAARARELALASVPVEAVRLRAERLAALLQTVQEDAARRLDEECERAGRGRVAIALAADAIGRMEGRAFVLTISSEDLRSAGKAFVEEVALRVGRGPIKLAVEEDPEALAGVRVRDAEGRQLWDNRLAARLERLWPGLRGRLLAEAGLAERPP